MPTALRLLCSLRELRLCYALDGFLSVERFESAADPGKLVSLSFWRDEQSLRPGATSSTSLIMPRPSGILRDYRIRVTQVTLDYSMNERVNAPLGG